MKYVHIVAFDPATQRADTKATCVLDNGSTVVDCRGDEALAAELRSGVADQARMLMVTPRDGEAFLAALKWTYRQPTLFATSVMEGDSAQPYVLPEPKKLG